MSSHESARPLTRRERRAREQQTAQTPSTPVASVPVASVDAPTAAIHDDAFVAASRAFRESRGAEPAAPADSTADTEAETAGTHAETPAAEASAHVAPRRSRLRKLAGAGATVGIMGIAGMLAISMTLPAGAIAAAQSGAGADAASLVVASASATRAQHAAADDEIQAYVASADLQAGSVQRAEDFSTVSLLEVAAEAGIRYSDAVYTNDPDAAIQWPFVVGVGMTYGYGMRDGVLHEGIDLVPGEGAPVQAIADGVARIATESGGGYGVTVYIDHIIDGQLITSHYSHMQYGSLRVTEGQIVHVGDIVGLVGNTGHSFGAHMHFELIANGSTFDPLPWMYANAGRYDGVTLPVS